MTHSAAMDTVACNRDATTWRGGAVEPGVLLWLYSLTVIGVGCLPQLPQLHTAAGLGALLMFAVLCLPARRSLLPAVLAVVAGCGWGLWHNQAALRERLPPSLHGADLALELQVISLPQERRAAALYGPADTVTNLRFTARVLASGTAAPMTGQTLDLTWYRVSPEILHKLRGGSRWLLPVRLKRPRGSVNPHGFDYEGWLLRRGIYATGYVRPQDGQPQWLGDEVSLSALRHSLRDRLFEQQLPRAGLLSALLLGDKSGLTDRERQLLRRTGTAHLLAISGLHVGMVAGFLLLLGGLLARLCGLMCGTTPTGLSLTAALLGTGTYTLLVGAPLSAQRALLMTWVVLLAWQWRRRVAPGFAFSLALASVLTLQPLAFYGAGFWLSFVAVAALLLAFSQRSRLAAGASGEEVHERGLPGRIGRGLVGLLRAQWVIALALLLPSLLYFSGFSVGGLLLNLVAIPWMGFVILPSLLLGALTLGSGIGGTLLQFAGWQLDLLMRLLASADRLFAGWYNLGAPAEPALILLAAGSVFLLLLPRGFPGRALGWLFVVPLVLPPMTGDAERGLQVTILDVGQGLAVVARAPGANLVYDTGPNSGSGWDAGSAIVAPYLLGEGVRRIDRVIVSHGDRDHAGGFAGVAGEIKIERILAPGALATHLAPAPGAERSSCLAGQGEMLSAMKLQWLWPEDRAVSGEENEHSCVALLQWRGLRVLLAGDVPAAVEQKLIERYAEFAPVDLLIAPHHGSRTSSSQAFIDWAGPANVVFSAGYRHHFGHPHPQVVARYRDSGARLWNTAEGGAITFTWRSADNISVSRARDSGPFWRRAVSHAQASE